MNAPPTFTHEELMQLWHAVSAHIENHDGEPAPEPAETACAKLGVYVQSMALPEAPEVKA